MLKFLTGFVLLGFIGTSSVFAFNMDNGKNKENPFDFKAKIISPSNGVTIFSLRTSSLKITPNRNEKSCGDYIVYNGDKVVDSGFITESQKDLDVDDVIFNIKCQEEDILVVID